ncbi:unnamed protein product [Dracunculus medinensis]|uniref:Uncharacterized protein n=1 Tax=Dracunculus medinensis TaxID=318479 RepID=A0A0N4UQ38_DRAME|nr:unnamed protein product [Dracunculus medinensis]
MPKYQQFTFIDTSRFSKWFELIRVAILACRFIKRISKNRFEWLNPISDDHSCITMKEVDTARQMQAQFEGINDNEITK